MRNGGGGAPAALGREGGLEGDKEPRKSVSWLPGAARRPVDGQGGEEEEGT